MERVSERTIIIPKRNHGTLFNIQYSMCMCANPEFQQNAPGPVKFSMPQRIQRKISVSSPPGPSIQFPILEGRCHLAGVATVSNP